MKNTSIFVIIILVISVLLLSLMIRSSDHHRAVPFTLRASSNDCSSYFKDYQNCMCHCTDSDCSYCDGEKLQNCCSNNPGAAGCEIGPLCN